MKHLTRPMILVVCIIGTIAFASFAVADRQGGYGKRYGSDEAPCCAGSGNNTYNTIPDLSEEQIAAIQQERDAFLEKTREIRENLYAKKQELQNELSKAEPDQESAKILQNDISTLYAQISEYRVEYMIAVKKIVPEFTPPVLGSGASTPCRGYGNGYGAGCPGAAQGANCPGYGAGSGGCAGNGSGACPYAASGAE